LPLLPLLVACAAPSEQGSANDEPRDSLVIGVPADVSNLLQLFAHSIADVYVSENLSYFLLEQDFDCRLRFEPALARSWELSADGRVVSFELRDDIRWPDGQPVTSADVAFTFDLMADPLVGATQAADLEPMVPGARPAVQDAQHLAFHFHEPGLPEVMLGSIAGTPVLPRHLLQGVDRERLREHPFNQNPQLNGPWALASWERGSRLILEPNPAWSGPASYRPRLERVVFEVIPEYSTRLLELQAGQLDLVAAIDPLDLPVLSQDPKIRPLRRGWRLLDYVGWNNIDPQAWSELQQQHEGTGRPDPAAAPPHPLFGDPAVRRALARAIDTERLIGDLLSAKSTGERYGRRAVGTITPALCDLHNDDIVPLAFEPQRARSELEDLGWKDSDGDGVLDRQGRSFRFDLITRVGADRRSKAALLLQADLRDVGIDMRIVTLERGAYFQRLRQREFDALLGGWSAGLFMDPSDIWHSGPAYDFNFVSYANAEADVLIERGLATPDPAAAQQTWKELQAVIYRDQPYCFLYWADEIVALHSRFQDAQVNISCPWDKLHRWWVPPDQVLRDD